MDTVWVRRGALPAEKKPSPCTRRDRCRLRFHPRAEGAGDRHYIETIGLDPEDPDWDFIGRDWARPAEPAARQRLYGKLLTRA